MTMLITILISLTFSQQDIKHVGVCRNSANFSQNHLCKNNIKIGMYMPEVMNVWKRVFSHYGRLSR